MVRLPDRGTFKKFAKFISSFFHISFVIYQMDYIIGTKYVIKERRLLMRVRGESSNPRQPLTRIRVP